MVQKEIDLFSIVNGELVINKQEARIIPSISRIIARDRGSAGDHDGRKKSVAIAELKYMYMMYSPYSIYRGVPFDLRQEQVLTVLNGIQKDWKEDDELKEAIKDYKDTFYSSPIYFAYINTSSAIYDIGKDIELFNNRKSLLRRRLEALAAILEDINSREEDIQVAEATMVEVTNKLIDLSEKILKISDKLPSNYENLEKLYNKFQDEKSKAAEIYGGGELGNREDL